jgi:rhodanese-related sulfurtransferase
MNRKNFFGAVLVLVLIAGIAFASSYPDAMMQKMMAMKSDAEAKKEMPASLPGIQVISGEEAYKMWKAKSAVFLDNRIKVQYETERIAGAEWFFCDDLLKNPSLANRLDKNKAYVMYCNGITCWRSPSTAMMLQHLDFKKIYWYRDGLPDWKKRGHPTE